MATASVSRTLAASTAEWWDARETSPPPPAMLAYAAELVIVFAAYFASGIAGLAVPFTSGNVSPVWPSAGIALAALLLAGYRVWPAIAAGAFLVNFLSPLSFGVALAIAAGNTGGPMVGCWLLRRLPRFCPSLRRLDDVLALVLLAAPASAAISATAGVTVLFITGVEAWSGAGAAWLVWSVGDALGLLVVTPLVLTFAQQQRITRLRDIPEISALLAATIVTCLMIFDHRVGGGNKDVLAFAVLPLVLWGAIRFEISGAAIVTFLVAGIAIWETGGGFGPFVRSSALQNAEMLQGFIATIAVSGLTLAAVIAERAELVRVQARREGVEQGESRFRDIVETANDGIWMLDGHLVTVFVNRRMADILGYTVEEMTGSPLSKYLADATCEQGAAGRHHQPASAVREREQVQYRRKDGADIWATVSRTPAFGDDGVFTGVLTMVCDITAQRRAEDEREEARGRLALLSMAVEQTADSVLISDSAGCIEYVNPAFEVTTGFTRNETLGKTPRLLKSGLHDQDFYTAMWCRLKAGEPYRGTLINRKKSGEMYWAQQTITPIRNATGATTHFVSVLKDVTDIRKYHAQEVSLRLARTVQQRFFPPAPAFPGFEIGAASYPAAETGGDYFDFIEAPHGVLYIAVGDVSGHGFDAALIMALTRAYMRSYATLGMDVGEVLARVNAAIIGDLEPERYVTMLLVRLDVEAGIMAYASAGHVPGVLLRCAGQSDCLLPSTGVPLGLFAEATCASHELRLAAEQILVLVTDGAAETTNAEDTPFGSERVTAYVRSHAADTAEQIAAGVYDAARTFRGGGEQLDDITTVVLKMTGPRRIVDQEPA